MNYVFTLIASSSPQETCILHKYTIVSDIETCKEWMQKVKREFQFETYEGDPEEYELYEDTINEELQFMMYNECAGDVITGNINPLND